MKKLFFSVSVIVLAFVLSVSAFAAAFTIDFGGGFTLQVEADTRYDLAKQAFEVTNQVRADSGLEPLIWDDGLAHAAMQRAVEASIFGNQTRPDGSPWSTISPDARAENLVYGALTDPQSAVEGFMSDEEYADNILNNDFTSIAVGCVEISSDEFYWIQLFGDEANPNPPDYYIVTFDDGCGSGISRQMIPEGGRVIRPLDPIMPGHVVGGWFRDTAFSEPWDFGADTVDCDMVLYLKWLFIGYDTSDPGVANNGDDDGFSDNGGSSGGSNPGGRGSSGGSSGSGGSGGGSGGFGGISFSTTSKPAASGNVGADGAVTASLIKAEAEKSLAGSNPTVKTKNAASISASTIKVLADLASKWGKTLTLIADTTFSDNNKIQGRIYIPVSSINTKNDIKLGVYTDSQNISAIKTRFEKWFVNKYAAVKLAHEGEFGGRVKVAAKVDLKAMNTDNLLIYSYNKEKNAYTRITDSAYSLDKNGYLHFYTDKGGDIIITDTALSKK